MRLFLAKRVRRLFSGSGALSVPTPDSISPEDALQILGQPSADFHLEPRRDTPIRPEQRPKETIFDLNFSRLQDMKQLFEETKDIELVNRRFGVQLKGFKYGLPIPNIDPGFKSIQELKDELRPPVPSALENLYGSLALTGDSSYQDYELAIQNRYHFHELLGGTDDETPDALATLAKTTELAIPLAKLKDEKLMESIRKTFTLNLNMPGCIETIDPRRFFIDLRPVEEFRHTPQIPISAAEMRRFEEAKERRRASPFTLVYTREKMVVLSMMMLAVAIMMVFFKLGMDAEERMVTDYRRKKLRRESKEPLIN